jgi:hypothetical protein
VFLSCGVLLPFQHCLPAHNTHAKKKNSPLPYPHIYHPHPLIEFAGAKIAPNQRHTLLPSHPSSLRPYPTPPHSPPGLVLTTLLFSSFRGAYDRNVRYTISQSFDRDPRVIMGQTLSEPITDKVRLFLGTMLLFAFLSLRISFYAMHHHIWATARF